MYRKLQKPHMMDEKNWDIIIRFDGGTINLVEEGDKLGHYLGDVTEECVRAVLRYGSWKAEELGKDRVQFSHPCSDWLIDVKRKKDPRYKRLLYLFK